MTTDNPIAQSQTRPASLFPRFVLGMAAGIALLAVGITLWKGLDAAHQAQPMPEVGDGSAVISKLESKLKVNPDDAESWRMLGLGYSDLGKYAEAAGAYKRATLISPGKAEYWSSLGEAQVLGGPGNVTPAAKAAFAKAIALDPKDPRARYFVGVSKDMAGDHRGAISDWLALLKDTPSGAPWEADVRRLISEVGTREKIDVAAKLASLRPAAPGPAAGVATAAIPGPTPSQMRQAAQLPKGQQDTMIEGMVNGLEVKLKANPNNLNGWIMLMRSRVQLGQTAKAQATLVAALAAFSSDAAKMKQIETAANELGIAH
jgi:cytochrome c-type biogenesis protein CcmH